MKSSKVSIKTRSTPVTPLSFKGQATKHTVKWSILIAKQTNKFIDLHLYAGCVSWITTVSQSVTMHGYMVLFITRNSIFN